MAWSWLGRKIINILSFWRKPVISQDDVKRFLESPCWMVVRQELCCRYDAYFRSLTDVRSSEEDRLRAIGALHAISDILTLDPLKSVVSRDPAVIERGKKTMEQIDKLLALLDEEVRNVRNHNDERDATGGRTGFSTAGYWVN